MALGSGRYVTTEVVPSIQLGRTQFFAAIIGHVVAGAPRDWNLYRTFQYLSLELKSCEDLCLSRPVPLYLNQNRNPRCWAQ